MCLLFLMLTSICSNSFFANDRSIQSAQENELTDSIFPRTDPKIIGLIYQMLKIIDLLFTKYDIPYWIDGGTALGAVRHQGCIPWDDDADLVFHIEDTNRILALKNEFATYGFYLKQENIIRLFPSERKQYPYIDLAGYRLCGDDDTYRFDLESARKYYNLFYWLPHEVNSLVRVQFGPLTLNAPNDMIRYIFTGYGDDCLSYAAFQKHHGGNENQLSIKEKVRIFDFSPADYEIENLQILLN